MKGKFETITNENLADALKEHAKLKAKANLAAVEEVALRLQLVKFLVPDPKEGANSLEAAGQKVTVTQKINYNIDRPALDAMWERLPKDVYEAVFRWSPDVKLDAYRTAMADKSLAKIISEIVVAKPGLPSIEIKPLKAKG